MNDLQISTPRPEPTRPLFARRRVAIAATLMVTGAVVTALVVSGQPADAAAPGGVATSASVGPLPATALTVAAVTPQQVTMARTLAASGSVHARDELLIGSDASGVRVVEVRVEVGAVVKRGQLLARGDDAQLLAQIAQQDAQIRQARAELAQAEANLERAERIKDSGVYSVEAVQTRRTAAEAAAAKLDLAQAQRRELEVRLGHTQVKAPADGVIARRSATVGAVMQPGVELFRLIRDDEIEWRAELADHALEGVKPGAVVRVRLDDTRTIEGRVRLVAPTVDARTRNGVVHVSLPRGTPLKAGGHVQGEIETGSAALWTLPESVLFSRDGQAFVYLIGDHGVARLTKVQTGARQHGRVEVRGLAPAAQVVATGGGFVKDGERVRVASQSQGARS
ncbi:MAG: efflux RND transporter periplasmic adaptor subunit [Pseudomonadota bacterium]